MLKWLNIWLIPKSLKHQFVEGDFSDAEIKSINSMAKYINEELQALDEEWEDE
jgi:hypothetical protein